jgi:hypothetical protein
MVQYLKHPEPSIQPAQELPLDLRRIVIILAVPLFVPVKKESCNLATHSHFPICIRSISLHETEHYSARSIL